MDKGSKTKPNKYQRRTEFVKISMNMSFLQFIIILGVCSCKKDSTSNVRNDPSSLVKHEILSNLDTIKFYNGGNGYSHLNFPNDSNYDYLTITNSNGEFCKLPSYPNYNITYNTIELCHQDFDDLERFIDCQKYTRNDLEELLTHYVSYKYYVPVTTYAPLNRNDSISKWIRHCFTTIYHEPPICFQIDNSIIVFFVSYNPINSKAPNLGVKTDIIEMCISLDYLKAMKNSLYNN